MRAIEASIPFGGSMITSLGRELVCLPPGYGEGKRSAQQTNEETV
jgi:hypothetical protein